MKSPRKVFLGFVLFLFVCFAHTAAAQQCCQWQQCPPHYEWVPADCQCEFVSPIIVDTTGKGFHLTSAQDGVVFDIAGDGHPIQMAWTAATSGNAFLALDRNGNGKIDNGKELFGNFTDQPSCPDEGLACRNGYRALAEFDKPQNGGNGDGIIDKRDAIFSHLLLWIDENHDGIFQPDELHTLPELGVFSLALKYRESKRTDEFGNLFRYKAAVNPDPKNSESKDGRWMFDVFFMTAEADNGVLPSLLEGINPSNHFRAQCGPPCAVPTDYQQTSGSGDSQGILHFTYAWNSSTGSLSDLAACTVREYVTYPGNSPFIWPSLRTLKQARHFL